MGKTYKTEKRYIPMDWGSMKLLILRPKNASGVPGILWLHGGGYATGMPEMVYFTRAKALAKKFGAVVIAPGYRLSGKAPYPAALEDAYAALCYLREHAGELGIDDSRIMVGGESAGGGLTAALCMYARDKGEVNIAFQMPLYPMLDDRDTESSKNNHAPVWNTKRNHAAWKLYLRDVTGTPSPYAAPARQEDYTGLPPAYTFVGQIEPFYCETLTYMENLRRAGIEAQVDVYPGCFHAFDLFLIGSKVRRQAIANFEEHYQHAVRCYTAPQHRK